MPLTSNIYGLVAGTTLLFSTSIAMSVPSQAAPFVAAPMIEQSAATTVRDLPIIKAQQIYRRNLGSASGDRKERNLRRFNRNQQYRNHDRRWNKKRYKHYRDRRSGSNIIGPAILGTIIGGAIANGPVYRSRLPAAHYRICDNRYRSYRAYDNTFQPYNGPRKQCVTRYFP